MLMKKKVIFVTKALWIGGIETALVNLLNHFDYGKYDVTLLVLRAELDMLEQINPNCRVLVADRDKTVSFEQAYAYSRLFHLTEESDKPSTLHKMMMWSIPAIRWVENRLYIRYIRNLMKNEQFDTAIIYSDVVGEIAVRAVQARKYLMYYHHGAMRHVYHDSVPWKKCEKIIAVSNNQAELMRECFPKFAEKITVIHNLTDAEGIRRKGVLPTAEVFDKTKFNIVSVGRVSHEKGMDIAVRVCAKLVSDGYDNVRWWIVGGGPAMQEVQDTIVETHMESHVITVGMQANPYPYIRQADLYMQPSRFEGYPMTILEALVLGQPVVSTDNNGAREILEEGKTGLLRQAEPEELEEAIVMLIENSKNFEVLKKQVQNFDFEAQNHQYIKMLEKQI